MNISPPGYCDLKYACPGPVWYTSKSFSLPKNNLLSSKNEPVSAKATLPFSADNPETAISFVLILLVPTPTPPEVATVTIPLLNL